MPFISICIPAYKRVTFLKRLLDSIAGQTFKDFEVIITDDSPSGEVETLCSSYLSLFKLIYIRNNIQMGTPENWNEAVRKAGGQWIKIMHDDDWFADQSSLLSFYDAIVANPGAGMIFSAYSNVDAAGNARQVKLIPHKKVYLKRPEHLLSENVIGPPSVTIYKNMTGLEFDRELKWLVDMDFYIRYLRIHNCHYINDCLVNIGINDEQVTKTAFRNAAIEIPEHFHVLEKLGSGVLNNIIVYDTFWRLIRNLRVRSENDFRKAGYRGDVPAVINYMVNLQKHIPAALLNIGPISKMMMAFSYAVSKR